MTLHLKSFLAVLALVSITVIGKAQDSTWKTYEVSPSLSIKMPGKVLIRDTAGIKLMMHRTSSYSMLVEFVEEMTPLPAGKTPDHVLKPFVHGFLESTIAQGYNNQITDTTINGKKGKWVLLTGKKGSQSQVYSFAVLVGSYIYSISMLAYVPMNDDLRAVLEKYFSSIQYTGEPLKNK